MSLLLYFNCRLDVLVYQCYMALPHSAVDLSAVDNGCIS